MKKPVILSKIKNVLHPSDVTWLSVPETFMHAGIIFAVVAITSLFVGLADTLFGLVLGLML